MKIAHTLTIPVTIGLVTLVGTTAHATEGVSPGAVDRMAEVNNACPTFSWDGEAGAVSNELVAYELPQGDEDAGAELTAETEVLYARVPGGASSWTPSAEHCFAPGGRYVWFVRAVTEVAGDQVVEASGWSAGRYFSVPAGPTVEELARAIDVIRRWEAAGGGGAPTLLTATATATVPAAVSDADSDADADAGWASPKSVPTASAAIRGEHPDTTGEKYGVVGTTSSYEGAGLAAANLGSGPDLVLDGSVNGAVDTTISEGVLTRSSPSDETFLFHNGGGGLLNIITHGTVTGDAFKVQYGTVIDDAGNWLGVGDTLPCPGCVASSDIADGSVATGDLADGAVTSAKIVDGQVRAADLGADAVTTAKILDGTIAAADLADGSVTGAKIGAGAVDSGHIRAGAVENAHLADNAVNGAKIQDGAVRNAELGNNAVTTDKIADGTITAADIDATSSIYVSKTQLYEREESIELSTVGMLAAEVYCDDSNDLPLVGWCTVTNNNMYPRKEKAIDWGNADDPAGWECLFHLEVVGGTISGYAHILCISVP